MLQFRSVVSNLIMLNAVLFLVTALMPQYEHMVVMNLGLWSLNSGVFEPWQLVSYMFLHGGFSHLFFNMFALYMFGRQLEYDLGQKRFLAYYMITGVGAGVLNLLTMHFMNEFGVTVGASGAVFGVLLAFGVLHPNERIMLLIPPIPLKAKWFVIGYGVLELGMGVANNGDNVAHFAHLGGMFFGLILLYYWRARRAIRF